jgi:glycosyltransferase involved in cell wall biosynthesis
VNKPKLSIITINLNNADGLRKTIESVVSQTFTDFEFIIIDGGSTDGSVDIIKQYDNNITYWISEPDTGIYNAMNKGILKATGEYLLFLNSGDWLADSEIISYFVEQAKGYDIIAGDVYLYTKENVILRYTVDEVSYGHFFSNSIPHAASFIKRSLFEDHGLYNESYKIASDWEFFFIILIVNQGSFHHIKRVVSFFDMTGISNKEEHQELQNNERKETLMRYFPSIYQSYKKLYDENELLRSHEREYCEYLNMKNGRFSFIIRLILFLKKLSK